MTANGLEGNPKQETGNSTVAHLLLGIDTSCDETSAAVVGDGRDVLSNIVSSQVDIHAAHGGIVPEIAARKHTEQITLIVREAMTTAHVQPSDLSAIAVTNRPGLLGALLVGVAAAKAMAYVHHLPLIGVHHIEGHLYANAMAHDLPFPHVSLVVSGGHTLLVLVEESWRFKRLGSTRDDAVGEAYDKVANYLGLGFPGGAKIDKLAREFSGDPIPFPRPMVKTDDLAFSYSGLKTAVRYFVERHQGELPLSAIAAGFQEAAVESLIGKTMKAARQFDAKAITVTGGVAANSALRRRVVEAAARVGIPAYYPPMPLCTDNGAMIAGIGYHRWRNGDVSDWSLSVAATAPIPA